MPRNRTNVDAANEIRCRLRITADVGLSSKVSNVQEASGAV